MARFQRAAGLTVDGVAGPSPLRALRHRRSSGAPSGPVRFLRPIAGAIGDGFGWVGGRRHTGVDIPADEGTPVGAAGRGVVVFAGWNDGGYGNLVAVKHRLGFESWYAHLSRIAADDGEAVVGGTRIGYVGSTGHTTGPHLHFEVRHFGTTIDPVPRLLSTVAFVAGTRIPYLAGYLATWMPIPGGLAVLDGGLAGALALYGMPPATAAAAVLVYHAIALWVPSAGGLIAYALLRRRLVQASPDPGPSAGPHLPRAAASGYGSPRERRRPPCSTAACGRQPASARAPSG